MKRKDIEILHNLTDYELAKEYSDTWYEYRKHGRRGANIEAYNDAVEKIDILREIITDRFVKRAYREHSDSLPPGSYKLARGILPLDESDEG